MTFFLTACFATSPHAHEESPLKTPRGPTRLQGPGLRFYSPGFGRWMSRDPAREQGGVNLYAFAWNSPVQLFDALGLAPHLCGIDHNGMPIYCDDPCRGECIVPPDDKPPPPPGAGGPALACVCGVITADAFTPDPTDIFVIAKCCGYALAVPTAWVIAYCLDVPESVELPGFRVCYRDGPIRFNPDGMMICTFSCDDGSWAIGMGEECLDVVRLLPKE